MWGGGGGLCSRSCCGKTQFKYTSRHVTLYGVYTTCRPGNKPQLLSLLLSVGFKKRKKVKKYIYIFLHFSSFGETLAKQQRQETSNSPRMQTINAHMRLCNNMLFDKLPLLLSGKLKRKIHSLVLFALSCSKTESTLTLDALQSVEKHTHMDVTLCDTCSL